MDNDSVEISDDLRIRVNGETRSISLTSDLAGATILIDPSEVPSLMVFFEVWMDDPVNRDRAL